MLPSCKEVVQMLSENMDQPIMGYRKFKLKLHLIMCKHCRRYGEQLELADKTFEVIVDKQAEDAGEVNPELREQLLAEFRALHKTNEEDCGRES